MEMQNVSLNTYNDFFVEDGIQAFASDYDKALIIMPTAGKTGFSRVLSSSIAEGVINYSSTPVLTINTKTPD